MLHYTDEEGLRCEKCGEANLHHRRVEVLPGFQKMKRQEHGRFVNQMARLMSVGRWKVTHLRGGTA
jgi:hypothetical protein